MEHHPLILSAKDVNIQFDLRGKVLHAIRGIDLDLYQGEVLAIVGESGSGKSVFTKSFMGLLDANGSITSGTIDYYGADDGKPIRLSDLKKEKDWLKVRGHEIAMIMQDPMTSLNPVFRIGAQLDEVIALHDGEGKTPEDMMQMALAGFAPNVLDERTVQYQCDCSAERTEEMLLSLGRAELARMRDEDPTCEVVCHFCHSKYQYDLNALLAEYDAQAAEAAQSKE